MEEFVSGQTDEIEVTPGTEGDVEFSLDMKMNNQNLLGKHINIAVADHCNELQIANNFSLANIFSWEGEVRVCLYCKKLRILQNFRDFHLANRNYQGMAFARRLEPHSPRAEQLVPACQPSCEKMERKWRENEEMERDSLSTFSHFLFISSLSIHFLYQKLSHFVAKC